ncbi:acyltransferase family protein [Promethearchaeum syntrophicum]|uniref:Acyltransferase family protein n=1 Tax=Promethearchaeum syntrophicum TaxID=2594042 RepID=A0A5B9D9A2_9ARCH|nr:acyltransferase family protein [Candidatus Prometheoarchaeum syntrophicum]QEE15662.1 Acyltransferase family protein [Candidatus Prometheoarchaeum syntrophicum]
MDKKLEISQNDLNSENDLDSNGDLKSGKNFFQVDIMKAWMIFLVILDHSTTHDFLVQFGSPLWERIAIPGFIIVMGFNLGISFKEKGITTLKEAYSKEYFILKMKRYIIPYIILYFIQTIIFLLVYYVFQPDIIEVWPYDLEGLRFLGFTFLWGPGMWFIPALFGSILVFPLLYICFKNAPIATFIFCFLIEWFMHILSYNIYIDGWFFTKMFFTTHIFYLFSGIGMGLWISEDHEILSMGNEISSMVTIIFWILLPISLLYLIIFAQYGFYQLYNFMYVIGLGWIGGDYHFLSFPYSAFLFLIVLKIFPKKLDNKFSKIIKKISRSTYHILLFQILYFSIAYHFWFSLENGFDSHPIDYLWYYPLNLLITIPGGIIWQTIEFKFYKKIKENKIYGIIYKILLILAVGFYVFFLFSRYFFFIVYPIP